MALDDSLAALADAWDAVPVDRRAAALDSFGAAALLIGDGLRVLKDHAPALMGPAISVGMKAVQEVKVWRRSPEWVGDKIEHHFPGLVAQLRQIARHLGLEEDDDKTPTVVVQLTSVPPADAP